MNLGKWTFSVSFTLNFDASKVRWTRLLPLYRELKSIVCSFHPALTTSRLHEISSGRALHRTGSLASPHWPIGDNIQVVCNQSTGVPRHAALVALRKNDLRQPKRPCPPWRPSLLLFSHGTFCSEWPAKGYPGMDEVLHLLPGTQGEPPQQSKHWHLQCPRCTLYHVHIDLIDPLPLRRGHRFLLTSMNRFTWWCGV